MPLGLYISVPFCRTKCSYCNFASDVFSRSVHQTYIDRVCDSIEGAATVAEQIGGQFERSVDSVFLGGGTPTVLDLSQLGRLFVTIGSTFEMRPNSEVTVECAPGTITSAVIDAFQSYGVNRVSLGVQSFVDREAASVGRLHKSATVTDDITRLRAAGITDINVDLIAGLPHQTAESWGASVEQAIACGVPHVSVYMLEVDEDSRLGRELIAGGTRYHAHFVPDEDMVADFYEEACERLNRAGILQYEISNFCREASESRHNLKYWTRQPYMGFGVDAHSMLFAQADEMESMRFSTSDSLEKYVAGCPLNVNPITRQAALEETFFLGLRLNRGVDLEFVERKFAGTAIEEVADVIDECVEDGLLEKRENTLKLTSRGRLLSNEVFGRFIGTAEPRQIRGNTQQPILGEPDFQSGRITMKR
jgi:oxygen-independent coproporphyrinogen-3 oxidase